MIALNSDDLAVRAAAIEVDLAALNVEKSPAAIDRLEPDARQGAQGPRANALWRIGLLGNRGVQPDRAFDILTSAVRDDNVNVRYWAVEGMAYLGTESTIAPLLSIFHDDPSPMIRERAACSLAQSGMLSAKLRLTAVPQLLDFTEDVSLDEQTRAWVFQALPRHHRTDPAARPCRLARVACPDGPPIKSLAPWRNLLYTGGMKNLIFAVITALALPVIASAQNGSGTANAADTKTVTATLEAMAKATIDKDVATLTKIYGDDLTYAHSSALTETKAEVLKNVQGPSVAEFMKFSDTKIRVYGDVALAKGVVDFRNGAPGKDARQPPQHPVGAGAACSRPARLADCRAADDPHRTLVGNARREVAFRICRNVTPVRDRRG